MNISEAISRADVFPVMDCLRQDESPYIFDFTANNQALVDINLNDKDEFCNYVTTSIQKNGSLYGIGRYNENRTIYARSMVFGTSRTVHLGIDIWINAGEKVYVPMDAVVHSFNDNNRHGDYGPTIILKHELDGEIFHTLYGHLSRSSLANIETGKELKKGMELATLGIYEENVHWPPHLHFQIICNMSRYSGDYPGVCAESDKDHYLSNCPDPNLILRLGILE